MALVFWGKNNPTDQCPAVFCDPDTGTFYMQGALVTDEKLLADIASASPLLDSGRRRAAAEHGGDHLGGRTWIPRRSRRRRSATC